MNAGRHLRLALRELGRDRALEPTRGEVSALVDSPASADARLAELRAIARRLHRLREELGDPYSRHRATAALEELRRAERALRRAVRENGGRG